MGSKFVQMPESGISVALLSIIDEEHSAVESKLKARGWQNVGDKLLESLGIYWYSIQTNAGEAYLYSSLIDKMGQAHSALETMTFLQRVKPSHAFMVGIGGALSEKQSLGSVVVAKDVSWHVFDKTEDKNSSFRNLRPNDHNVPMPSDEMKRQLTRYFSQYFDRSALSFDVIFDEIFSWDYVATGREATDYILQRRPKAKCVEMEGAGFLCAVEQYGRVFDQTHRPAFIVRGLSDCTVDKSESESENTRRAAALNAVEVASMMISDLIVDSRVDLAGASRRISDQYKAEFDALVRR